jgi:LacI family gluconate utilization system Gnt-I transcriptional repressor
MSESRNPRAARALALESERTPRGHKAAADAGIERAPRRGHGRITLREVAEAAGVTSITVSRYLREPAVVGPHTAARIRDALAATGYLPNKQAGLLASGHSNIVAVVLPNLANSIFAETAQGLADTLQAAGHELLIASSGYSLEREEQQLRALLGWRPAAVVITGRRHSAGALELLTSVRRADTPVIEIWDWHLPTERAVRRGEHFTQVGFSHDEVGRAMAQHLLQAGHRRLAYVDSGVAEDYRAHERGLAFAAAARDAGATAEVFVAPPGEPFDAGRRMLAPLLASQPAKPGAKPQAAFTAAAFANDHLASGALLEAARQRVPVPERLALLGFGDFAWARQLDPPLSSVALPRYDIGVCAARAVLDELAGSDAAAPQAMRWSLVARASTVGGDT